MTSKAREEDVPPPIYKPVGPQPAINRQSSLLSSLAISTTVVKMTNTEMQDRIENMIIQSMQIAVEKRQEEFKHCFKRCPSRCGLQEPEAIGQLLKLLVSFACQVTAGVVSTRPKGQATGA